MTACTTSRPRRPTLATFLATGHDGSVWLQSSQLTAVVAGALVLLLGGLSQLAVAAVPSASDRADPSFAPVSRPSSVPSAPTGPTIRTDLLAGVGLEVEEVGTGVFRVVGDGIRDLSAITVEEVVSGHDGSTWLVGRRRAFRLGQSGTISETFTSSGRFEVGPDGTVWTIRPIPGQAERAISAFDGTSWAASEAPPDDDRSRWEPWDPDVAADGTVWATWTDMRGRSGSRVARLDPDGWRLLDGHHHPLVGDLVITDAGEVWLQAGPTRYQRCRWRALRPWATRGRVGRDGTVWLRRPSGRLVRFDDGSPRRCTTDEQPDRFRPRGEGVSVGPDGALWGHSRPGQGSVELARFDCSTWQDPLPGVDIGLRADMAFAVDGSVWVLSDYLARDELAGDVAPGAGKRRQLYVITPRAVAAGSPRPVGRVPEPSGVAPRDRLDRFDHDHARANMDRGEGPHDRRASG